MKKLFAILMVLAMAGACKAIQPVFVRDPFNIAQWYGFMPADSNGEYWWRVGFSNPNQDFTARSKYFCIDQIFYGKVHKGKVFVGSSGKDWMESGYWSSSSYRGWNYRKSTTQNSYVDVPIPAGYNRIHLLSYDYSGGNGALLKISWDDGTYNGIDVNSYDSGTAIQLAEVVIATNASPDGVKKLRIKHNDDSGTARIVGVICWDSDSNGDPATARDGEPTKWEGHNLIDKYHTGYTTLYKEFIPRADDTVFNIVPHDSTIEWAMYWRIEPYGEYKWSGGQNHWNTVYDADYIYHSGSVYEANGPSIFADGTDKGGAAGIANNTLITGNSIHIASTGFLDAYGNGTEDPNEPDVTWEYDLSPNGMSIKILIAWQGVGTVSTSTYCPMLNICYSTSKDKIIYPLDANEYDTSSDQHKYGAQWGTYLVGERDIKITMTTVGPTRDMYWLAGHYKLYSQYLTDSMFGGAGVEPGDIWVLGGNWQVTRVPRTIPDGDIDCDGKVDFYDFTILADNWLIDCFNDPDNPACVSQ
jgi:hypothetical protein